MPRSKSKKSHRSLWIFVIAIFVMLFALLYSALPQQTLAPSSSIQTANWKTYEINGYSFKYPQGYYVQKSDNLDENGNPYVSILVANYYPTQGEPKDVTKVNTIYFNDSQDSAKTIESLLPVIEENYKKDETTVTKQELMKVNGFNLIYQEIKNPGTMGFQNAYPVAYALDGKGRVVTIAGIDMDAKHVEFFNQVLSTFRFTN